jgi:hypothetical protein
MIQFAAIDVSSTISFISRSWIMILMITSSLMMRSMSMRNSSIWDIDQMMWKMVNSNSFNARSNFQMYRSLIQFFSLSMYDFMIVFLVFWCSDHSSAITAILRVDVSYSLCHRISDLLTSLSCSSWTWTPPWFFVVRYTRSLALSLRKVSRNRFRIRR